MVMTELILNMMALEVILHIDELLFMTLVPETARLLTNSTVPLKVPRAHGAWLSCTTVAADWGRLLIVGAGLALSVFTFVAPMADTMRELGSRRLIRNHEFSGLELI